MITPYYISLTKDSTQAQAKPTTRRLAIRKTPLKVVYQFINIPCLSKLTNKSFTSLIFSLQILPSFSTITSLIESATTSLVRDPSSSSQGIKYPSSFLPTVLQSILGMQEMLIELEVSHFEQPPPRRSNQSESKTHQFLHAYGSISSILVPNWCTLFHTLQFAPQTLIVTVTHLDPMVHIEPLVPKKMEHSISPNLELSL